MRCVVKVLMVLWMLTGLVACSGGSAGDRHPVAAASPATTKGDAKAPQVTNRKIIRDASVTISVDSVTEVFQKIRDAVPLWGGFFANSEFRQRDQERYIANLKIRVPSEKLDQVLADLSQMGRVTSQSESGQDVTDEYTDTESHLRNLQTAEKRLLELMERTGSVKDLLEAEKEVTRTRGEIERLQGRLNQLDNLVSYSTVEVSLVEKGPIESQRFWNLGQTVMEAWSMFLHILRAAVTAGIYAAFLSPFALLLWLLYRLTLRMKVAKVEKREPATPQGHDDRP